MLQAIKDAASLGLEPTGLGGEGFINVYKGVAVFQNTSGGGNTQGNGVIDAVAGTGASRNVIG